MTEVPFAEAVKLLPEGGGVLCFFHTQESDASINNGGASQRWARTQLLKLMQKTPIYEAGDEHETYRLKVRHEGGWLHIKTRPIKP